MSLAESPVFVEYMERATAEAIETSDRSTVEIMMVDRFGAVDDELSAIIPNIIKLPKSEYVSLVMHMSRQELIDRFA